ncbi:uncharacterized protein LOC129573444 [Sitodiplosis mosellana]|uniref:uncharacterized protein LOC129573444 n=1 Tax=Sitodiplosis mosellana TaxID=263140 RepID=UPI0024438E09|nr:uncharacterized protein LOC129573444 [Sitodiplosis mosellana]
MTALHRAAETGDAKEARKLIDNGADVNIENNVKQTPLHYAAMKSHTDVAKLLIDNGAKVDSVILKSLLFGFRNLFFPRD